MEFFYRCFPVTIQVPPDLITKLSLSESSTAMWNLSAPCVSKIIVGSPDATSISKTPLVFKLPAMLAAPAASIWPLKNKLVNLFVPLVPKATSSSVTGSKTPSFKTIWSAPAALNIMLLSVAKSISLSASLPTTKLVFVTDVIPVSQSRSVVVLLLMQMLIVLPQ